MSDADQAFIRGGPLPRDLAENDALRAAVGGTVLGGLRRGAGGWTDCYSHGPEPVTDDTFIVCFECGHAWTRSALEEANYLGQLSCVDDPIVDPPTDEPFVPKRMSADEIGFCPECIHDF